MAEIWAVVWEIIKNWWAYMSCAIWTGAAFWQLAFNPTSQTQIKIYFIAAGASLLLGFLQTIFTEHHKRITAEKKVNDNRPILGINTSSVEGPKTWAEHPVPVTFYIQHLSGRLPTAIRFDHVLSKQRKFSLVFSPLPYANRPPHPTGMSFEVIEVGVPLLNAKDWERTRDTQKNLLDLFLYDSPKELMRLDYPLISHFMDGDDPCSQAFCLRFEMDRTRFSADTTPCANLSS